MKASLLLSLTYQMTNEQRLINVNAVQAASENGINFDTKILNDTACVNTSNSKSDATLNITLSAPIKQEKISILKGDNNFQKKLFVKNKEELAPSTCAACGFCDEINKDCGFN